MITLKQAISKAKKLNPDFDIYSEYDSAYVFCQEKYMDNIGGKGTPYAIMKETGKVMPFTVFLLMIPEKEEPVKLQVRI